MRRPRGEPSHWWADHRRAGFSRPAQYQAFAWRRLSDGWGWIDSIGPYVFTLLVDEDRFWRTTLKVGDTHIHTIVCSTRREAARVASGLLDQIERLDSSYDRLIGAVRELREALELPPDGKYE